MALSILPEMWRTENFEMLKKVQCIPLLNLGNIIAQVGPSFSAVIIEFSNMQTELEKARLKEKQLLMQLDSCKCSSQRQLAPTESTHVFVARTNSLSTNKKFKTPEKKCNAYKKKLQNIVSERDNLKKEVDCKNLKFEPLSPVSLDLNLATISDKTPQKDNLTPDSKESSSQSSVEIISIEDKLIHISDETNEIDGTPTGRTSPVIGSRKPKSKYGGSLLEVSNQQIFGDDRSPADKNRSKFMKQRRNTKLKQSRLTFNNRKPKSLLDVSTSNLFDGGSRAPLLGKLPQIESMKGSTEDEDVILPSPTSDHIKMEPLSGSSYKFSSPKKRIKLKSNSQGNQSDVTLTLAKVQYNEGDDTYMPGYSPICMDTDNSSPRILIEASPTKFRSPKKEKRSPLSPNNNATNVVTKTSADSREPIINRSLSLLKTRASTVKSDNGRVYGKEKKENNNFFVKEPEPQFIFKEAPVRKQAEKRQLPGWSCRECKEYYGEAYKDDEDKLFEAMQRCSRHRGRFNPERPHTPPGFWDVRMSVPDDTQELNRRNNAI